MLSTVATARSATDPDPNSNDIDDDVNTIRLMVFFFIFFTGLVGNSSLLLLFATKHKLAVAYHRLLNLAISNSIACFSILIFITGLLTSHNIFNVTKHCVGIEAVTELWWVSQNMSVTCISYSRYRCISKPYQCHENKSRIILNVSLIWGTTFIMAALLFTPSVITTYDENQKMCRRRWESNTPYTIIHVLVSFVLPAFALFFSHVYMLRECYLKQNSSASGMIFPTERTIHADQYGAAMKRSVSTDWSMFRMAKDGYNNSTYSSTERSSEMSFREIKRKESLNSNSIRKSLKTIVFIFGSYLLACVPQLVVIICYTTGRTVSINLGQATLSRYSLIITFPYIFGLHSRTLRKELLKMCKRLQWWRSNRIVPSLNIDEKDYTNNVMRRDSRRSSLASRKNSMNEPPPKIPPPHAPHTIFVRAVNHQIDDQYNKYPKMTITTI